MNDLVAKFMLSKEDWISVLKGSAVAGAGAALAIALEVFWNTNVGPVGVALLAVLANYARKVWFNHSGEDILDNISE
jgi:hypothetical protein